MKNIWTLLRGAVMTSVHIRRKLRTPLASEDGAGTYRVIFVCSQSLALNMAASEDAMEDVHGAAHDPMSY